MGALPRPELPPGPHRDLVVALHDLHHRAGWPSLRTLAGRTGVSHTTVSHLLSSPRLPAWGMVELLVEALGGSPDDLHALWLAATTPEEDRPAEAPPQIAGRTAELAAVRRHLEAGTGLLVVAGEAGIGKTTLVDAAARSTGVVVTTTHCLPLATEISLLPVVDGLTMVHEVDDGRWLEEALEDLPAFVRRSVS
ncbi:MAG TPA: AAA family ATPase, partial [Nocardioides sp.]|nr:AAA family ATPase [Nocardioides sp.]